MSFILKELAPPIAWIWLNRPEKHHAFNAEMMHDFSRFVEEFRRHPDIRVVILSSRGAESFCAGGDVEYFQSLKSDKEVREMSLLMQDALRAISEGPRFYIAAINGNALGGGLEILSACHYRMAVPAAKFGFRQAANGIITGWGGGRRMMDDLGPRRALQLFLCAQTLTAKEAQAIGLIDEICPSEELTDRAGQLARRISAIPSDAFNAFMILYRERHSPRRAEIETELFVKLWFRESFQNWSENFLKKTTDRTNAD